MVISPDKRIARLSPAQEACIRYHSQNLREGAEFFTLKILAAWRHLPKRSEMQWERLRKVKTIQDANGRGHTTEEERSGIDTKHLGRWGYLEKVPGVEDPTARRVSQKGLAFLAGEQPREREWGWSPAFVKSLLQDPELKAFWDAARNLNLPLARMGGIWLKHALIASDETWMRLPTSQIHGCIRGGTQYVRMT